VATRVQPADKDQRDSHSPKVDAASAKSEELSWEVAARDARLAELEAALRQVTDLVSQVGELERRIVELRKHAMRIPSLEARISKLEAQAMRDAQAHKPEPPVAEKPAVSQQDSAPPPPPSQRTDNLRAIRGIGRAIEHSLHGLGIRTFEAIAAWTAEDIERFATLLNLNPQRIRRDRWVQRAQEQVKRRTNPPPNDSGG
jgi:predicted flap endonuclease-1-like 5' DNA nuclease